jgi:hypothetical protein
MGFMRVLLLRMLIETDFVQHCICHDESLGLFIGTAAESLKRQSNTSFTCFCRSCNRFWRLWHALGSVTSLTSQMIRLVRLVVSFDMNPWQLMTAGMTVSSLHRCE